VVVENGSEIQGRVDATASQLTMNNGNMLPLGEIPSSTVLDLAFVYV